jgi:hypothetical protein
MSPRSSGFQYLDIRVTCAKNTVGVWFTDSKGQPVSGANFSSEQLTYDDADGAGLPALSPVTQEAELNQPDPVEYILWVEASQLDSFDIEVSANQPAIIRWRGFLAQCSTVEVCLS